MSMLATAAVFRKPKSRITHPSSLGGMLDRPDALPASDDLQGIADAILSWKSHPDPYLALTAKSKSRKGCAGVAVLRLYVPLSWPYLMSA